MGTSTEFKAGEILFHQGDTSDRVLRVTSGRIEILRTVGTTPIVLGEVGEGEWLGEMGVIENRGRNATARAVTAGEFEAFTPEEFLDRVSREPGLARDLILRLSVRLSAIEDKIAGDMSSFAHGYFVDRPEATQTQTTLPDDAQVALTAETDVLRARIGAAPIPITHLPFVVGRVPAAGEAQPSRHPDLLIADKPPFRLSRDHFMVVRFCDRLLAVDLGSALGTIVNGQAIGHHFRRDDTILHAGENEIIAGGRDSPFAFTLSIGQDAQPAKG